MEACYLKDRCGNNGYLHTSIAEIGVKPRGMLCVVLVAIACLPIVYSESSQPPKYVRFSLEKERLTLGDPVLLDLEISNPWPHALEVDLGEDSKEHLYIFIDDPLGRRKVRTARPRKEGLLFLGRVRVAPGETYSQTLVLNEWFEFRQTGRYRIFARLDARVKAGANQI
ncbi:MAG TPA: hypothetical protein VLE48_00985, partial [Terriglobales bacterium]|nr:hypothetical protein [Terriglobales bacterium]